MKRRATAVWNGTLKEGSGKLTTQSKLLNGSQYSFGARFEEGKGTNPEELLAAAHAGCFAMALSMILGESGYTPESLDATAVVKMDTDKLEITESHIKLKARIPGIEKEKFLECANNAKDNCVITKALNFKVTLDANLE